MKNIIKKSSMLTVLGVLAIVGIASAALLTTYVSHTTDADISQAVTWGNGDTGSRTYTMAGVGGSTYTVPYGENWNIENNANNPVDVEIVTKVVDQGWGDITNKCAIEHEVYGDGVPPIANGAQTTLPAESGDLPFTTEITLPANHSGVFTITTSVNPA